MYVVVKIIKSFDGDVLLKTLILKLCSIGEGSIIFTSHCCSYAKTHYLHYIMTSKRHSLVPIPPSLPAVDVAVHTTTDWSLCCLCQEEKKEPLTDPSKNPRADVNVGYMS